MDTGPGCLVEEDLLRLVGHDPDPSGELRRYEHLDRCTRCRSVLAEVLRASAGGGSADMRGAPTFNGGDLIAGRYEIRGLLGRGGMGEVYSAYDQLLSQIVAVKTIAHALAGDAKVAHRLKTEVSLARRATHRNVCRLFDAGTHERRGATVLFITMELLEGRTLRAHLQEGALSQSEIIPIAAQVAAGLDAVHAVGVIHRDLKPENVMIVQDGPGRGMRAVVMDFGLARPAWDDAGRFPVTSIHGIIGTPAYMAPEQLVGQTPTIQSDIYSFGVILNEIVALRSLVPSAKEPGSPGAHWWARRSRSLTSRGLQTIADRCLQRNPRDRFQSMREVEQGLRNVQRLWRRRPGPRALAVLAVLVTLAGGLAVRQLGSRLRPVRSAALADPVRARPGGLPEHLDVTVPANPAEAKIADDTQAPRELPAGRLPSPSPVPRTPSRRHRREPSVAQPNGPVDEAPASAPSVTAAPESAVTLPASKKPILDRSNPYQ